jgi:four helix bundle protein
LKEANETLYWLELLFATNYITKKMYDSIVKDATELLKILIASIKTTKARVVSSRKNYHLSSI